MKRLEITEERELSGVMRDTFRRIKINTEFSGQGQKSICITSTTSNEGKTTVAIGLAKAFAEEEGKKVLLVDADVRKSCMNLRLGYDSESKGLTEYITGKSDANDVIYKTNIDGFYLTPAGRMTNNSTQLFKRESFAEFIKEVKEAFDMVIIDTPPQGLLVDASIIAALSDACLLVVASNMVSRKEVKKSIMELKKANENFLGVILNKTKEESDGYNRKYYHSYSAYNKEGKQ